MIPSNDAERTLLRIVVEIRDPCLETPLSLVHAEPTVLGRVSLDPGLRVAAGLADGSSHSNAQASQLRHATAGLPLGLAPDIAIKPEAVLPPTDDREGLVELFLLR